MRSIGIGQRLTSGFFASALILLIGFYSPLVLGHNFSPDESAKFLGLVDIIKGEAQLVQDDLASKNVSLANQHANRALALVTDNVTKEIAERNTRLSDDLYQRNGICSSVFFPRSSAVTTSLISSLIKIIPLSL